MACRAVWPAQGTLPSESSTSTTGGAPAAPRTRSTSRLGAGRQPAADHVRIVHRGREADAAHGSGAKLLQARQAEREQVAALGGPDRVDLVDDHAGAGPRNRRRAPSQAQNRASCSGVVSRMSGGLTRWRWRRAMPVSPVRDSARDRQAHLGDRRHQVALDVDRQRLQRRDVEGVDAARRVRPAAARSARSGWAGSPARVLPPPVGAISRASRPGARLLDHRQLVRARRPAARGEPGGEARREQGQGAAPSIADGYSMFPVRFITRRAFDQVRSTCRAADRRWRAGGGCLISSRSSIPARAADTT